MHTSPAVNRRIDEEMERHVTACVGSDPRAILLRLEELEREWDIERTIEATFALTALVGLVCTSLFHPAFLILTIGATVFLFQHAMQGWSPPVPILRRLGFRTAYEIEQERYALKALRGDFRDSSDPPHVIEAVRR